MTMAGWLHKCMDVAQRANLPDTTCFNIFYELVNVYFLHKHVEVQLET
jgi:hypothetical protein